MARLHDFMASLKNITLAKIRADWTVELGEDMDEDNWNRALQRVNDSTSCVQLGVIQFKVLHRAHFSNVRLDKLFPNSDASCDRCRNTPANLTHMFWSCPALTTYWSMIFKSMSDALSIDLHSNAAIFGITASVHSVVKKSHKNIIAFATLLALASASVVVCVCIHTFYVVYLLIYLFNFTLLWMGALHVQVGGLFVWGGRKEKWKISLSICTLYSVLV